MKDRERIANRWWYSTEFRIMEAITGLRQSQFNPSDGSQAFVDACDSYWENLTAAEKITLHHEYQSF